MSEEEVPIVRVDFAEARVLADMASVLLDLNFTIEACKRLISELDREQDKQDSVVIQALWTAALIAYARCFATGVRLGLSEDDLAELPGDAIAVHRHYKTMRDKHIAHSVNPFEEVGVGAALSPESAGKDQAVEGIATFTRKHISETVEGVNNLGRLAATLRNAIVERAKVQQSAVLERAREIPIERLKQGQRLTSRIPGRDVADQPRTQPGDV